MFEGRKTCEVPTPMDLDARHSRQRPQTLGHVYGSGATARGQWQLPHIQRVEMRQRRRLATGGRSPHEGVATVGQRRPPENVPVLMPAGQDVGAWKHTHQQPGRDGSVENVPPHEPYADGASDRTPGFLGRAQQTVTHIATMAGR